MNTRRTARRARTTGAAFALCWALAAGPWPDGSSWAGIVSAAESAETPASTSDPGDAPDAAPAPAEIPASAGSSDPEDAPEKPEAEADQSEEVFVPSEAISEDIDVPFPVDI